MSRVPCAWTGRPGPQSAHKSIVKPAAMCASGSLASSVNVSTRVRAECGDERPRCRQRAVGDGAAARSRCRPLLACVRERRPSRVEQAPARCPSGEEQAHQARQFCVQHMYGGAWLRETAGAVTLRLGEPQRRPTELTGLGASSASKGLFRLPGRAVVTSAPCGWVRNLCCEDQRRPYY